MSSLLHSLLPLPLPVLLHLAQLLLATVLATLFGAVLGGGGGGSGGGRDETRTCLLATRWQGLWRAHDARAIRGVQDALGCCGFRTTRDMAWPFPSRGGGGGGGNNGPTCEEQFGRHEPCLPAWEAALRRACAAELAVVLCVGVMQLAGVILAARYGYGGANDGWWGRMAERVWGVGGGRIAGGEGGSRRPLLVAAADGDGQAGTGYRDRVEEAAEEEEEVEEGRNGGGEVPHRGAVDRYGGGPRVEPSHHDPWAGVQRE